MATKKIDGFGILRGVDEDDEGQGEMQDLDKNDIGKKFALRRHHREHTVWKAVGYDGTWGREGKELSLIHI